MHLQPQAAVSEEQWEAQREHDDTISLQFPLLYKQCNDTLR